MSESERERERKDRRDKETCTVVSQGNRAYYRYTDNQAEERDPHSFACTVREET